MQDELKELANWNTLALHENKSLKACSKCKLILSDEKWDKY
jgi:hypothetical protein